MKKISVFLVLILSITFTVFGNEAQNKEIFSDEAYSLINHLCDISEYIPENKEGIPTRKEFVYAAVNLFNCHSASEQTLNFVDVATDDDFYPVLKKAVANGLVLNGYAFNPDAEMELLPALKICVIAAGYKNKAEAMGGYPNGYISVANTLGILRNMPSSLSYSNVYTMFFNTLKADQLIANGVGPGDNINYVTQKNKTVLEFIYNIKNTTGIMTANEFGMLGTENYDYTEGKIKINDILYTTNADWNKYLGYNLSVYYEEDENSGELKIRYLYPKNTQTFTLRNNNAVYSNNRIKYLVGDKEKDIKLNASFDYIYNGKPYYSEKKYVPENGEMLFIDNNSDGYYDVLSVTDYRFIKATTVNTYDKIITDTELSQTSIDVKNENKYVNITNSENEKINLFEIKPGSILAVRESKDKSVCYIKVMDNSISGKLTEIDTSDKKIEIDGTEYEASSLFSEKYFSELSFDTGYTFVLGIYNDVIAAFPEVLTMKFGYITNLKNIDGIDKRIKAKIFTTDGKFITPFLAEKVVIDGASAITDSVAYTLINNSGVPQLIKYMLNKEGEISKIDLPEESDEIFEQEIENEDDSLKKTVFSSDFNFRQGCFYPHFIRGSATVFVIPIDITKEKLFAIGHNFGDGDYDRLSLIPYNVGADGVPEVIVYRSDAAESIPKGSSTEVVLIDKAIQALDENNQVATKIYGWCNGEFVEYMLDSDVEIKKSGNPAELVKGDLLRITRNKNTIYKAMVDFDAGIMSQDSGSDARFNVPSNIFQYQIGKVYSVKNGCAYISNTKNTDGTYNFDTENLICVILPDIIASCDEKGGIRNANETRIKSYLSNGNEASYLVVQQHYLAGRFAVIY